MSNHLIRKITPAGVVSTLAGSPGITGSTNGSGAAARFSYPSGVAVDASGNVYVADAGNGTIRKITPAGAVSTLAGQPGMVGSEDGAGAAARFYSPGGVAVDGAGHVYVADTFNHRVRKISPAGNVTTLAGQGTAGSANGTGTAAQFNYPHGLAVSSSGTVFVADRRNHTIRAVTAAGVVSTLAGLPGVFGSQDGTRTDARFKEPFGVALDTDGNLYITDKENNLIRKSTPAGNVTTLAGLATVSGSTDGRGREARFGAPMGIAADRQGNVYVADADANRIRRSVQPPTIIAPPPHLTLAIGGTASLFMTFFSDFGSASWRWLKNGVDLNSSGFTTIIGERSVGLIFLPDRGDPTGVYSVVVTNVAGSVTSAGGMVTVVPPPVITTQPQSIAVTAGLPAQFSVGVAPPAGASYQWRKNGLPITGATSATLSFASTALADAGTYTVVVTQNGLSLTSNNARLAVGVPVSVSPVTHTVTVGSPVTFSFTAAPAAGTTFQWRKNGTAISGATQATFSIASAAPADAGDYTRVSTSGNTSTLSPIITLTVVPLPPPVFLSHPASQSAAVGTSVKFSVSASSSAPLVFQWYKDGVLIPGATEDQIVLTGVSREDVGTYSVVASNSAGTATSAPATLTLTAPVVIAPSIREHPLSQTVNAGATIALGVTVAGSPPLRVQWYRNGTPLMGATNLQLLIPNAQPSDSGRYTVTVSNSAGTATSTAAEVTVPTASRLANLSVRTATAAGQTVIVGLAVDGDPVDVLVRAVGPGLAAFGVSGAMADPQLELYRGPTLVLANNDWPAALAPAFVEAGAFGLTTGSQDAAFRQGLVGPSSIHVRGPGPGVVLFEAYDLTGAGAARLVNVSARSRVGTGDDVLIAGFGISGTGTKRLLIRAVGPALAGFGVTGTLADPVLELFTGATKLAENDDWPAELAPQFAAAGAFALTRGSRDAALVVTLPPGAYTAQVHGSGAATGEALVEIYEVP
ncbi:MAG: immunoglobulin domain-containing protein [Acidobacteria bacterium]|nr:immunoglobulin domain-containing protein [Acidobacteriota bacterium]